jgi:hypothetical protein
MGLPHNNTLKSVAYQWLSGNLHNKMRYRSRNNKGSPSRCFSGTKWRYSTTC